MARKTIAETIKTMGIEQVLGYIDKDPDTNIPKMLDWLGKNDSEAGIQQQLAAAKLALNDPENNWFKLVRSIYHDIDRDQRETLLRNVIINATMIGYARSQEFAKKENCNIPWAILLDPTSACNLHCTGCWAADYGNKLNMTYDELDDIITQGKALGTYTYVYSGGEPLVRKKDIIKLCEKHQDCSFLAFTNSTLIDEAFADEMLRVKNFVPAISVEGFQEDTDFRRGNGTYQKVMHAMDLLRERHLLFGVSCCYTSKNAYTIGSDEYMDFLIDKGCMFAWFFTYMPVGVNAPTELMAKPEQRKFMYDQVRKWRAEKPIFTLDFWNDGEYVEGCIAGGRRYLHINANGDIEPCAFIHFSDSNIREKTLLEAYKSPMFMAYHDNQPFSDNMLRPCPLLDNKGKLAQLVHESGAKSTDMEHPEDVDELCEKCGQTADAWKPVAEDIWNESVDHNPTSQVAQKQHAEREAKRKASETEVA